MRVESIFNMIVPAAVIAVLAYMSKATSKPVAANAQGEYVLRMHRMYQIIGWIGIAFGAAFAVSPIFIDDLKPGEYLLILMILLLFGGLGALCVLYYRNHYVRFDDTNIEIRSVRGKMSSGKWENVERARFSKMSGLLTLTEKDGNKLKAHYHLVGMGTFREFLNEKKPGLKIDNEKQMTY